MTESALVESAALLAAAAREGAGAASTAADAHAPTPPASPTTAEAKGHAQAPKMRLPRYRRRRAHALHAQGAIRGPVREGASAGGVAWMRGRRWREDASGVARRRPCLLAPTSVCHRISRAACRRSLFACTRRRPCSATTATPAARARGAFGARQRMRILVKIQCG